MTRPLWFRKPKTSVIKYSENIRLPYFDRRMFFLLRLSGFFGMIEKVIITFQGGAYGETDCCRYGANHRHM